MPTEKQAEVFAINGLEPEVLAYAMAKYSRSSLSMKESIYTISSQRASDFLNTFYFSYGHKSIADMAHVPLAVENISLLAAIDVVDEQRWDGQERSTRYQNFSKREYYTPPGLNPTEEVHYHETMHMLFDAYEKVFALAVDTFKREHPQPEEMDSMVYLRTLNARAFDVARYLLPLSTLTSVGQITSARTLESQVSRMLASPYAEVRALAEKMKSAAVTEPAYTPYDKERQDALEGAWAKLDDGEAIAVESLLGSQRLAPTLVKYAEVDEYRVASRELALLVLTEMRIDSAEAVIGSPVDRVELHNSPTLRVVLAGILYEHAKLSIRQLLQKIAAYGHSWVEAQLAKFLALRGLHDELPRGFRIGTGHNFDIITDIGAYRDLHRHRRVTHISQAYSPHLGFAAPEPICSEELREVYWTATQKAAKAFEIMQYLRRMHDSDAEVAAYLLPMGTKHRFLMNMDMAELAYISELRTGPAGHISYRRIAWEMYQELHKIDPTLAHHLRVHNPNDPSDFFKR